MGAVNALTSSPANAFAQGIPATGTLTALQLVQQAQQRSTSDLGRVQHPLPHVQVQAHARAQLQPESQQQQQCSPKYLDIDSAGRPPGAAYPARSESHTASGAAGSAVSGSRGGGSGTDTSMCTTSRQRKRRKRKQLDAETVVRMFLSRNDAERWTGSLSNTLAAEHGLTAQAIRDIWNLRTWRK